MLNVCHRRGNQNAKHPKDGRRTGVSSLVVGLLLRVRVKAGQMSYIGTLSAAASLYISIHLVTIQVLTDTKCYHFKGYIHVDGNTKCSSFSRISVSKVNGANGKLVNDKFRQSRQFPTPPVMSLSVGPRKFQTRTQLECCMKDILDLTCNLKPKTAAEEVPDRISLSTGLLSPLSTVFPVIIRVLTKTKHYRLISVDHFQLNGFQLPHENMGPNCPSPNSIGKNRRW